MKKFIENIKKYLDNAMFQAETYMRRHDFRDSGFFYLEGKREAFKECLEFVVKYVEEYKVLEKQEEKYTLEEILDAITQSNEEIVVAIMHKDREMLEDTLKEYLV